MYTSYCIAPGMWNVVDKESGEIIDAGPFFHVDEAEKEADYRFKYDRLLGIVSSRGLLIPHPNSPLAYRKLVGIRKADLDRIYGVYMQVKSADVNTLHHAAVKAVLGLL